MRGKKAALLNSRSRLQRIRDAKFFNGWIKGFDDEQIHVQLASNEVLELGDIFVIEVHGADCYAMIKGKLGMVSESIAVFTFMEKPRYFPPKERVRVKVEGVSATLGVLANPHEEVAEHPMYSLEVEVNDVSHEGVGILSSSRLDRGTQISLLVDSPAGPVQCKGEVRYCKPEPEHDSLYRIGILLQQMGRLELARWTKMIEFAMEAA
jgi:hypothetical protein